MASGGRLGTSEARRELSKLVKKAARRTKPSKSLLDNAVEIGSYRRPGAVLVPEVDVRAHVQREEDLERRVEELEDELDEILLGLLVEDRLKGRELGRGKPIEQVARELGFGQLVDDS